MRTRTSSLLVRSQALCPIELRAQKIHKSIFAFTLLLQEFQTFLIRDDFQQRSNIQIPLF